MYAVYVVYPEVILGWMIVRYLVRHLTLLCVTL